MRRQIDPACHTCLILLLGMMINQCGFLCFMSLKSYLRVEPSR
jgi:hypothetical protein